MSTKKPAVLAGFFDEEFFSSLTLTAAPTGLTACPVSDGQLSSRATKVPKNAR